MDTLRLGALDVREAARPASPEFPAAARRLVSVVKAMAQSRSSATGGSPATNPAGCPRPGSADLPAGCAGGSWRSPRRPEAPRPCQSLLAGLPPGFATPIVVVQHITPGFSEGLAAWLGSVSPFRVKVADDGEPLAPRTVYVAPDGTATSASRPGAP